MAAMFAPQPVRVKGTKGPVPWAEKYRPKSLDDVACQEGVVAMLKSSLTSGQFPHLLFYGPPGTGKTSTILAIARSLWGPELFKDRVLELNASDERGISVVRNKIKNFAQISVGQGVSGYPCPPFKLIILDEADSMTSDAQTALRRTMEAHTKVTRFCIICNYVSRIIEPLASRCAKFRFTPLKQEILLGRVQEICELEGAPQEQATLEAAARLSGGDMRKAITLLQSGVKLYGEDLNAEALVEVAGTVPDSVVNELIRTLSTNSFDKLQVAIQDIKADGYSAEHVLSQLTDTIIVAPDLSDIQKARAVERIAQADKALRDGADEFLQLLDSTAFLMRVYCGLELGPA